MDDRRKNICFIIPNLDRGGSEKVFLHLLQHINLDKFRVTAIVVTRPGIYFDLLPVGVNKVLAGASKVKYSVFKLYKLIKASEPDLIFTFNVNHLNLIAVPAARLAAYRSKLITRESNVVSVVNAKKGRLKHLVNLLYRFFYRWVDVVICQSQYMKQDILGLYKIREHQTTIVNNPVLFDTLHQRADTGNKLFTGDVLHLLAVGRLTHQKGFDLLLRSLPYVEARYHLTIVGGATFEHPEYQESLLKLVEELDLKERVTFQGFEENPYPYMQQADVLLLPSRHEGFPNVALEAMSLGTPVISFDSPGGQNDLIRHGENGYLVKFGDLQAFAGAIDLASTADLPKEKIINFVKNNHDIAYVMSVYEKLIDKLASNNSD